MKKLSVYKTLADAFVILEFLFVGYLLYSINSQIAIFLFITFLCSSVFKILVAREEHKEDLFFIKQLSDKIEEENKKLSDKSE